MDDRKIHLETDLDGKADKTVYIIRFFVESESGGLDLYETLKTDSPPMIPDVGQSISFDFVTEDETEEEVFRNKQGGISPTEISSEGEYTKKRTTNLEVVSVKTTYEKCVTKTDEAKTKVKKTITLRKP